MLPRDRERRKKGKNGGAGDVIYTDLYRRSEKASRRRKVKGSQPGREEPGWSNCQEDGPTTSGDPLNGRSEKTTRSGGRKDYKRSIDTYSEQCSQRVHWPPALPASDIKGH